MFWIAPLAYLIYPPFWRGLKDHSAGYGALYLLYLTFLATCAAGIFLFMFAPKYIYPALPIVWKSLPTNFAWSSDGIEVNKNKPFAVQIGGEVFGMIDTSISDRQPKDMERYDIYATHTHIYVKEKQSSYRIVSLKGDKQGGEDAASFDVQINDTGEQLPELKVSIYKNPGENGETNLYSPAQIKAFVGIAWKFLAAAILTFGSACFFVWKFMAALVYSLFALILSQALKLNAPYGRLLNASIFALTPAIVLKVLSLFITKAAWLGSIYLAVAITCLYIFVTLSAWKDCKISLETL